MKLKILLLTAFIIFNLSVYVVTEINKSERVEISLSSSLNELQTAYKSLQYQEKIIVENTIEYVQQHTMDILSKLPGSTKEEKDHLRKELYDRLILEYKQLQRSGVYQFHFCLPDNRSFLRMHKLQKYGDDLSKVRYSFVYTNMTKKPIDGFEGGKVTHGLRYVRPLFDHNGNYLCAVEVSFSSDYIQNYLTTVNHLHSHFLINKNIFETNTITNDLQYKYVEAAENGEYMLLLTNQHKKQVCVIENKEKLIPSKEKLLKKMDEGKSFSIYVMHDKKEHYGVNNYKEHVDVISFLPIFDTQNKISAWLVSYNADNFITMTIWGVMVVRIVSFFIFLLFVYLAYKIFNQKKRVAGNRYAKNKRA